MNWNQTYMKTITALSAANGVATVEWSAPTTGTVTAFEVQLLDAAGDPLGTPRRVSALTRRAEFAGLTNGTGYRFQVRALNEAGTGPFSAPRSTPT